jgi:hypothetical protein
MRSRARQGLGGSQQSHSEWMTIFNSGYMTYPPGRAAIMAPGTTARLLLMARERLGGWGLKLRQSSSCNSRSQSNRNEITGSGRQGLGGLPRLFCTTDLGGAFIFCLTEMQILSDGNANPGGLVQPFARSACKHPNVTAPASLDQQKMR